MSWVLMAHGKGYVARADNPDSYTSKLEQAMIFETKQAALAARSSPAEIVLDTAKIVKNVRSDT